MRKHDCTGSVCTRQVSPWTVNPSQALSAKKTAMNRKGRLCRRWNEYKAVEGEVGILKMMLDQKIEETRNLSTKETPLYSND